LRDFSLPSAPLSNLAASLSAMRSGRRRSRRANQLESTMLLDFGKHAGKTTQFVFLKTPDFALWAREQDARGKLAQAVTAFGRHEAALNAKAFVTRCRGCQAPATRGSYYNGTTDGLWWCDDCDPYSLGALDGKLSIVRTFNHAMQHVQWTCSAPRQAYREIVKDLSQAKGAPKRLGAEQAAAFLP